MGKVAEFFADLKINGDTLTLKDMLSKMGDLRLMTIGEITSLGVLGDMLKNAGVHAMDMATGYTTLSKELGLNTDLLQRWQNVARASNVPAEAVANSFANIQKILTGFKQGQINTGFLQGAAFLNIPNAAGMTYDQLLEVLRQRVPNLIRERGRAFTSNALGMMGIDPAMIQMLELSRGQFAKREFSQPIVTSDQIRQWTELNNQVAILHQQLFMLGEEILGVALPEIVKWTQVLIDSESLISKRFGKSEEAAASPYVEGRGLMGVYGHALMSLVAPQTTLGAGRSTVPVVHNTKVDIHVRGDNADSVARETKRQLDRHQGQMNTAIQAANGAEAY